METRHRAALRVQEEAKTNYNPWIPYRNSYNEIDSKFHIRTNFLEESRSNSRKLHFNKKNPTKSSRYYKDLQQQTYKTGVILDSGSHEDHIFQTSLPNAITYSHEGLGSRIYNCKFTSDGQSILVTSQNGTSFFKFADDGQVELSKVITCFNINWTITDSDISSDNQFMVHSTLSPYIHMFNVQQAKYSGQFNINNGNSNDSEDDFSGYSWYYRLRVYSLKLSANNKEVIAGCGKMGRGAPVQVYDLENTRVKESITAHTDDINSVCYVDKKNSSIFITGSDDGLCKIWDTRILKDNEPVGIFNGHVAGVTCVSSKEDNRYFISNSKDQSIKLWDIRKACNEKKKIDMCHTDYRYNTVNRMSLESAIRSARSADQSLMTFQGHQVHTTLIRCHFSPLYGTGQRYVYSGSYDGIVYIYDTVTGENIMKLELPKGDGYYSDSVVRDCAWHPYSQSLISTSFHGAIHKWEFMDFRDAERLDRHGALRGAPVQTYHPLGTALGDLSSSELSSDDGDSAYQQVFTDLP